MTIDEIKKRIKDFDIQNTLTPASYISKLFKDFNELNNILIALKELLKDQDDLIFLPSLNFFVYLMNNSKYIPGDKDNIFVELVEEDYEIFEILREQLYSKNIYIRQNIISALIELKYEECLEFLKESFNYFMKNDPINLPVIINGIIMLGDEIPVGLIDRIINNENYIIRWTFLQLIELVTFDYKYLYNWLNILMQDKNEQIKIESKYWYEYFKNIQENELSDVYKESYDNNYHERSGINYESIINSFFELLEKQRVKDYTINELEDFTDFYIQNVNRISDI